MGAEQDRRTRGERHGRCRGTVERGAARRPEHPDPDRDRLTVRVRAREERPEARTINEASDRIDVLGEPRRERAVDDARERGRSAQGGEREESGAWRCSSLVAGAARPASGSLPLDELDPVAVRIFGP